MQACALVHRIESRRSCIIFLVIFITPPWVAHGILDAWSGSTDIEARRERRRRGGESEGTLGPPAVSGDHKNGPAPPFCLPLCLPLYPTHFPLFIPILKDSRPLLLRTDKPPYRRTPWLVAKHCRMLNGKMQTRLTPLPPREASSQLENTTMHDTRRSIKAIDQRLFTPMSPTHTSIVSKVYGESESSLVWIL